MRNVTIRHTDTCTASFVQDHCNGDNELLIGQYVDGATTLRGLRDNLLFELVRDDRVPEGMDDEAIGAAVRDMFANVEDIDRLFDPSLDVPSDDDDDMDMDEGCQAWFRLSWED